ncbi:SDR family NAD(P)-dependent oxidoreductase [Variovorax sp. YR566]|uniref:SDR family NAD(P)-dependent oxidoreductase n=1 Tax=Variovorax sp. YR566 TaxID=3450237 RepID=UPI003F7D27F1
MASMDMRRAQDRPVAIVTGASRGIGRAVARGLASDGYAVVLVARGTGEVDSLAAELEAEGATAIRCPLDVANEQAVAHAVRRVVDETGRVDVLFNGAGIVHRGTSSIADADLRRVLDTNLLGAINLVRAAAPVMKAAHCGHVINVASRSAVHPKAGNGGYAASKAALRAYGEALCLELAKEGVKVSTLCPSYVHTDQSARQTWLPDAAKIPPSDLHACVRFLLALSPAASVKELIVDCSHVVAHGEQYL